MIKYFTIFWIAGLLTLVPYAAWQLLYYATHEQYALLITFILFWIFGYWSLAGPLIAILKVRSVYKVFESASKPSELKTLLLNKDNHELVISLLASENKIPRFLARRIYYFLIKKYMENLKGDSN